MAFLISQRHYSTFILPATFRAFSYGSTAYLQVVLLHQIQSTLRVNHILVHFTVPGLRTLSCHYWLGLCVFYVYNTGVEPVTHSSKRNCSTNELIMNLTRCAQPSFDNILYYQMRHTSMRFDLRSTVRFFKTTKVAIDLFTS